MSGTSKIAKNEILVNEEVTGFYIYSNYYTVITLEKILRNPAIIVVNSIIHH